MSLHPCNFFQQHRCNWNLVSKSTFRLVSVAASARAHCRGIAMASIFLLVETMLACSLLLDILAAFHTHFTTLGMSLLRDTPFTCTFCEC